MTNNMKDLLHRIRFHCQLCNRSIDQTMVVDTYQRPGVFHVEAYCHGQPVTIMIRDKEIDFHNKAGSIAIYSLFGPLSERWETTDNNDKEDIASLIWDNRDAEAAS